MISPILLLVKWKNKGYLDNFQRACSIKVYENSGPNWSKLGSFIDKRHIIHVIDLILYKMGKRLCNSDFSFLPMPLVSIVKDQSKLPKSLLVGDQCLDRLMFCLKPFDFNDFGLKLTKYSWEEGGSYMVNK